ncbi:MAG: GNAT family N-acetyltransferase [Longimicrobiales bacterium]
MAPQSFVTSRLTARCWEPADAALALEAIGASLPQLQLWTPWVVPQPFEIATLEGRFRQFHEQFQAGQHFIYGLFDHEQTRVIGQAGLYGRIGLGALEIGYWIRSDATGRGYASDATRALAALAFLECSAQRVQVRCDPEHVASAAIPRRLGFINRGIIREPTAHGSVRDTQVWELLASEYGHPAEIPYTIAQSVRR